MLKNISLLFSIDEIFFIFYSIHLVLCLSKQVKKIELLMEYIVILLNFDGVDNFSDVSKRRQIHNKVEGNKDTSKIILDFKFSLIYNFFLVSLPKQILEP